MTKLFSFFRPYLSPVLLFMPALLFAVLLFVYRNSSQLAFQPSFPYLPFQFLIVAVAGLIATAGGVLDWRYHRNPLNMKIPKKERDAEAAALGLGGLPMFVLMWAATMSGHPNYYLLPIVVVLIYTVAAISYDEFVFHIRRCKKVENTYHRMLVFGNGIAWLAWFQFIFYK